MVEQMKLRIMVAPVPARHLGFELWSESTPGARPGRRRRAILKNRLAIGLGVQHIQWGLVKGLRSVCMKVATTDFSLVSC